jgi:hypothetical protein
MNIKIAGSARARFFLERKKQRTFAGNFVSGKTAGVIRVQNYERLVQWNRARAKRGHRLRSSAFKRGVEQILKNTAGFGPVLGTKFLTL